MNILVEDYKKFKEKEINLNFQNELKKLQDNRELAISKLTLLDDSLKYKSEAKFLYGSSLGFKFVQDNPKYTKLFLKGFLEDNLDLIQFGDIRIYDNENKKSVSFKEDNVLLLLDSLLEDNKEYTVILKEDSSYIKEYIVKEINLSLRVFFDD